MHGVDDLRLVKYAPRTAELDEVVAEQRASRSRLARTELSMSNSSSSRNSARIWGSIRYDSFIKP
jgi:hypothetical protein